MGLHLANKLYVCLSEIRVIRDNTGKVIAIQQTCVNLFLNYQFTATTQASLTCYSQTSGGGTAQHLGWKHFVLVYEQDVHLAEFVFAIDQGGIRHTKTMQSLVISPILDLR